MFFRTCATKKTNQMSIKTTPALFYYSFFKVSRMKVESKTKKEIKISIIKTILEDLINNK